MLTFLSSDTILSRNMTSPNTGHVTQPPLQLRMVLWLSSGQWEVSKNVRATSGNLMWVSQHIVFAFLFHHFTCPADWKQMLPWTMNVRSYHTRNNPVNCFLRTPGAEPPYQPCTAFFSFFTWQKSTHVSWALLSFYKFGFSCYLHTNLLQNAKFPSYSTDIEGSIKIYKNTKRGIKSTPE